MTTATRGRRTRSKGPALLWQLGVALVVVQAIVAVVIAIYAAVVIRRFHHEQAIAELERLVPLVTDRVAGMLAAGGSSLGPEASAIAAQMGVRVTLVGLDGRVVADSDRDPATMDDHRYRSEIDAAISGGAGAAARFSGTMDMVYAARRAEVDGRPVGIVRLARPLTDVDAAVARIYAVLAPAAAASLVVTLGVILLVSRRLSARVAALADGAARFASGDFRHRIPRPRERELATLADALNRMASQVSNQIGQLESQRGEQRAILQSMSNGVIALDLEQRVLSINRAGHQILQMGTPEPRGRLLQEVVREPDLNRFVETAIAAGGSASGELELRSGGGTTVEAVSEPLEDADDRLAGLLVIVNDVTRLRRLERIRSDFAANVSHELRTPITNIKGYAETMLDVGFDDVGRSRGFLEVIRRNASRLDAIIEDLLALARLEHGERREAIERVAVALPALVSGVVAQFRERARSNAMTMVCDVEPDAVVSGAPQLIEQALGNLISNAISYGGKGTKVTVTGRRVGRDEIEVAVADEGPGITPQHLSRIFERFYRVDRARSRDLGGTGLGLAIVKHVALVHGGRAEVESTVGRGSTFRLILPAA